VRRRGVRGATEMCSSKKSRQTENGKKIDELAEPEGFEPSIRLFNRITV
jgi:hypothetical protein